MTIFGDLSIMERDIARLLLVLGYLKTAQIVEVQMGRIKDKTHDREHVVASVMLGSLPEIEGPVLVVDNFGPLGSWLKAQLDVPVLVWSRFVRDGVDARSWPDAQPVHHALIRLPKGKDALNMAVAAACTQLVEGGTCDVYGANDEGIRSTAKKLGVWFDDVQTVQTQRKSRVIRARGLRDDFQSSLADWMSASTLTLNRQTLDWVSWPGLFAKGKLDDATALLMNVLDRQTLPERVLDYGCGTGVLARYLLMRGVVEVDALDADALAIEATRHNAPGVSRLWLADRLSTLPDTTSWQWVVSNPPFHQGKDEDFGVMRRLIADAARRADCLWMVTQRQIPCGQLLEADFRVVEAVERTSRFTVWQAKHK